MSRFSFQGRRRRFGPNARRKRGNRGVLAGLNLGLGALVVVISVKLDDAHGLALLGLPYLAAGYLVLREKSAGTMLSYLGAGLIALAGFLAVPFAGRLTPAVVGAFAALYLVRQTVAFDAWREQREIEREEAELARLGLAPDEDAPARTRFFN